MSETNQQHGNGSVFRVDKFVVPSEAREEILVKVAATGVCHTDLVVRDGMLPTPLPVVLGHEGAGVVEAVGAAITKVKPGDHVVMTFNSCGACPSCRDHATTYCHEFFPRNFFAARVVSGATSAAARASALQHLVVRRSSTPL